MKVDNKKCPQGHPLDNFKRGDCIRLASGDSFHKGNLYIVAGCRDGRHQATNLFDGCYRDNGMFVLEPNAKVVIE